VALKDLRDTFASQLLTCGVSLGWISEQLGHADLEVTAKRYARWCGGAEYREPMSLRRGEVPTDLLARIEDKSRHKSAQPQNVVHGNQFNLLKLFSDLAPPG